MHKYPKELLVKLKNEQTLILKLKDIIQECSNLILKILYQSSLSY